jgi:hypothetical protein
LKATTLGSVAQGCQDRLLDLIHTKTGDKGDAADDGYGDTRYLGSGDDQVDVL